MRGVHYLEVVLKGWKIGSSPHARGPQVPLYPHTILTRIIPACAGSTGGGPYWTTEIRIIPACAGSTIH